jgi:hypothetical protein
MEAFWSVLEWGANTILFVWMGIILAIVLPPSHENIGLINHPVVLVPSDAGYVVILFLWLQVGERGWRHQGVVVKRFRGELRGARTVQKRPRAADLILEIRLAVH